jgi:hypothetical protein
LVVQKRARRGVDPHFLAVPLDVKAIERLHRRFRLAFGGAEGGEVVPADEQLRSRMHGLRIKAARHPPRPAGVQGETGAAVDDAVEVMALARREPGVEAVGGRFRRPYRHRMGSQMGIDGVADGVGLPGPGKIEMGDLTHGVHARIGAPGPLHMDMLAAERGYRRLQHALDRHAVVLHLPADERRAVIFDQELVARHV